MLKILKQVHNIVTSGRHVCTCTLWHCAHTRGAYLTFTHLAAGHRCASVQAETVPGRQEEVADCGRHRAEAGALVRNARSSRPRLRRQHRQQCAQGSVASNLACSLLCILSLCDYVQLYLFIVLWRCCKQISATSSVFAFLAWSETVARGVCAQLRARAGDYGAAVWAQTDGAADTVAGDTTGTGAGGGHGALGSKGIRHETPAGAWERLAVIASGWREIDVNRGATSYTTGRQRNVSILLLTLRASQCVLFAAPRLLGAWSSGTGGTCSWARPRVVIGNFRSLNDYFDQHRHELWKGDKSMWCFYCVQDCRLQSARPVLTVAFSFGYYWSKMFYIRQQ